MSTTTFTTGSYVTASSSLAVGGRTTMTTGMTARGCAVRPPSPVAHTGGGAMSCALAITELACGGKYSAEPSSRSASRSHVPHVALWFRREDYQRIRQVMDDGDGYPAEFDAWEARARVKWKRPSNMASLSRQSPSILKSF